MNAPVTSERFPHVAEGAVDVIGPAFSATHTHTSSGADQRRRRIGSHMITPTEPCIIASYVTAWPLSFLLLDAWAVRRSTRADGREGGYAP